MAIVKMKHLQVLALEADRDPLFDRLQKLGCLEVSDQSDRLSDPEWSALARRDESSLAEARTQQELAAQAISLLDRYAPAKTGLLAPLPQIQERDLFDAASMESALETAARIREDSRTLTEIQSQLQKERTTLSSLKPWEPLDVPLETGSTGSLSTAFLMIPATAELTQVRQALESAADTAELYEASTDMEMHYLFLLCHSAQEEDAMDELKRFGATGAALKGFTGTAAENIARHQETVRALESRQTELEEKLAGYGEARGALQLAYDQISQSVEKETCKERLLAMDQSFLLEGWVTETDAPKLEKLLSDYDCAFEIRDPEETELEQVPVKLKNNLFTRCMNVVTEMYSLPAYDGLDPNPLMAPFFIFFFGMMMADMGYGILMIAAALVVLKVKRPRTGTRNFMELVLWCGVSTLIWGALTGGFFGDFIPQLAKIINPNTTLTSLPHLFTPLDDTVAILLGSLVLGLIQVITGMAISVVKKTKDGHFADALWDEITWWVILAGLAVMVLTGIWAVLAIGGLMLLYGSTRNAKGFGKVAALIGAIYNGVTGFFSDILSYLRLMALMLSGSVIAQVFNTLGAVFGSVIPFIIISMIGNAMNLALNLLGCYVHDLRLQCLEYFGRFYKEGGKPYSPLSIQTKYNDIIKEE